MKPAVRFIVWLLGMAWLGGAGWVLLLTGAGQPLNWWIALFVALGLLSTGLRLLNLSLKVGTK